MGISRGGMQSRQQPEFKSTTKALFPMRLLRYARLAGNFDIGLFLFQTWGCMPKFFVYYDSLIGEMEESEM